MYDRVLDLVPQVLTKIQEMLTKKQQQDELEDLAKTAETQAEQPQQAQV